MQIACSSSSGSLVEAAGGKGTVVVVVAATLGKEDAVEGLVDGAPGSGLVWLPAGDGCGSGIEPD